MAEVEQNPLDRSRARVSCEAPIARRGDERNGVRPKEAEPPIRVLGGYIAPTGKSIFSRPQRWRDRVRVPYRKVSGNSYRVPVTAERVHAEFVQSEVVALLLQRRPVKWANVRGPTVPPRPRLVRKTFGRICGIRLVVDVRALNAYCHLGP